MGSTHDPETGPPGDTVAIRTAAPVPEEGAVKVDVLSSSPPGPTVFGQLGGAVSTAVNGVRTWTTRPVGRLLVPGLLIIALLAVAGVAGAVVGPQASLRANAPAASAAPTNGVAEPAEGASPEPVESEPGGDRVDFTPPAGTAKRPADVLAAWAAPMAGKLGIPAVAMQAYGYAELTARRNSPACNLSWSTLAGIGKIESDHGRAQGATLGTDGKSLPSIVGAPLDGQGNRKSIPDTDGGQLDTDRSWDRAVGPMQFIPATWKQYAVDADNDGMTDVNDIDDASLAAANYLCASGRDLNTPEGWKAAVAAYNAVDIYLQDVFNATNDYGRRSRG